MIRRRGSILLEFVFLFLLVAMIFSTFSSGVISIYSHVDRIYDHVTLHRVGRDLIAIMERQLSFYTAKAVIKTTKTGSSLCCYSLGLGKSKTFFRRPYPDTDFYGFYQSTQTKGKAPGVNPLTPPDIGLDIFQVEKISPYMVRVKLRLTMLKTGRHQDFFSVLYLRNGVVL